MKFGVSHRWDLPVGEARGLQEELADKVVTEPGFDLKGMGSVAGVDASYRNGMARAAIVVLSWPALEPLDWAVAETPVHFPYVPGLLAFREGPSVMEAMEALRVWPDLFVFDAQGLAHPRRLGLASHLGVILDMPTIGCAKSRLTGQHGELGNEKGAWVPLVDEGVTIGAAVRTRTGTRPMYVSIGHKVDLATAINVVLQCSPRYRLPETTRYAHRLASGSEVVTGLHRAPTQGRQHGV